MRRSPWIAGLVVAVFAWPRSAPASVPGADSSGVASATSTLDRPRPPTHARDGMRIGAIAGAAAGAPLFMFGGYVAEQICEYGCPHVTTLGYVGLGVVGGAVGAISGAVVGGLVGGLVPAGAPPGGGTAGPRPFIASVGLQSGAGRLTERAGHDSGAACRVNLLARARPWLAVGPELSMSGVGDRLLTIGGVVQAGFLDRRVSPYLVGDLGGYFWKSEVYASRPGEPAVGHGGGVSLLGSGIGAGLLWGPGGGRARLGIEARYHWTPQHIDHPEAYRFVEVAAGARWNW